jgi:FkbM family methyltransferase
LLSGFFGSLREGFYVDVGANHPIIDSVTKHFYDKGWHGINIEPNKRLYELLTNDRPRDININAGISSKPGRLAFREYVIGSGLSTFSSQIKDQYSSKTSKLTDSYKDYQVKVVRLEDIFSQNAKDVLINFLKIDVEGFEYEVIESNDWKKYRPQVLCIEANHIVKDWRPLMKKYKYTKVYFDGLNEYYVANEYPDIRERFSYVDTMLLDRPILQEYFYNKILRLDETRRQTELKLIHQELLNQNLSAELSNLLSKQEENKRLRTIFKQLAIALNNILLIYIEKLNRPKVNKNISSLLVDSDNVDKLLSQSREYDVRCFYRRRSSQPLIYRSVLWAYNILKKLLKLWVRVLIKIIVRIRDAKNDK